MNQELEQYLQMFIDHRQEQWLEWLGTAEFAYNNKVHTGTKVSPFKANNGQDPRMGFEMRKKGKYEGAERFAEKMKNIQEEAKAALQKAQEDMKQYVDRERGEVEEYRVGDGGDLFKKQLRIGGIDMGICNECVDQNIKVLYRPYKSGYYRVRESKSPSCSTIVCNRVDTGEVIKYKREGLTR